MNVRMVYHIGDADWVMICNNDGRFAKLKVKPSRIKELLVGSVGSRACSTRNWDRVNRPRGKVLVSQT